MMGGSKVLESYVACVAAANWIGGTFSTVGTNQCQWRITNHTSEIANTHAVKKMLIDTVALSQIGLGVGSCGFELLESMLTVRQLRFAVYCGCLRGAWSTKGGS